MFCIADGSWLLFVTHGASCTALSVMQGGAGAPAAPLRLEGLWNPQLLFSSAAHIQPNTLDLGGSGKSGTLLLTGARGVTGIKGQC